MANFVKFLKIDPATGMSIEHSESTDAVQVQQVTITAGGKIDAGAGNVTNMADGVAATDAVAYGQLQAEATTRSDADQSLATAISTEASIRTAVDGDLSVRISAEASIRGAVDTAIQTSITNEISIRTAGDQDLRTSLDNEVSTRGAVMAQEVIDRTAGDNSLSAALYSESTTRAADDNALSTALDNEISTRAADDLRFPLLAGGRTFTGIQEYNTVQNLEGAAATAIPDKNYVDQLASVTAAGMLPKLSCDVATVVPLPACTYANGTNGVGATLTASAEGALTVDGVTATAGMRILVKEQVAKEQNGIYDVTNAGSAGSGGGVTYLTTPFPGDWTGVQVSYYSEDDDMIQFTNTAGIGTGGLPTDIRLELQALFNSGATIKVIDGANAEWAITLIPGKTPWVTSGPGLLRIARANWGDVGFSLTKDGVSVPDFTSVTTATRSMPGTNIFMTGSGGTPGTAWILTRSTDFDGAPEGEIKRGSFTYVTGGVSLARTGWQQIAPLGGDGVMQASEVGVAGDGDIVWTKFSELTSYEAVAPIVISAVSGIPKIQLSIAPTRPVYNAGGSVDLQINTNDLGVDGSGLLYVSANLARQSALDAEASIRAAHDSVIAANLYAETTNRLAADVSLTNAIAAEASIRGAVDGQIFTAIDNEVSARIYADGTLATAIVNEASIRAANDVYLAGQITSEATTRSAADTSLYNAIDAEATARMLADQSLQEQIGALDLQTAYNHGNTIVTTENRAVDVSGPAGIRLMQQTPVDFDNGPKIWAPSAGNLSIQMQEGIVYKLPTTQGAAGTTLVNDGTGQLRWDSTGYLIMTAGETLAAGALVRVSSANTVIKATADSMANADVVGVAAEGYSSGAQARIMTSGMIITGVLANATPGTRYFLGTDGSYSTTRPTASGNAVLRVGYAVSPTDLMIMIGEPRVRA